MQANYDALIIGGGHLGRAEPARNAPRLGQIVADWTLKKPMNLPIAPFRIGRFALDKH